MSAGGSQRLTRRALLRTGGGPLQDLFGSQGVTTHETQPAGRQPRLGNTLKVAKTRSA